MIFQHAIGRSKGWQNCWSIWKKEMLLLLPGEVLALSHSLIFRNRFEPGRSFTGRGRGGEVPQQHGVSFAALKDGNGFLWSKEYRI